LQSANLRNVRAGSDRWQPRILQSEPVLPRARRPSTPGQTKALSLLIAIYRLSHSRSPPRACAATSRSILRAAVGGRGRLAVRSRGSPLPSRPRWQICALACLILFGCTSSCFSVRAEVSTAPRVIAGRNPPAPHTTPRRTRGAFALTDLTLRIQQTLEALDIFRAVAGLPIIRVTEMLHPSTFLEVRVSCSTFVRIFLHKTVAGQGDGRLKSKGVVRCVNRREMKYLTRRRTRNGSQS
jgi:hypothetical protein